MDPLAIKPHTKSQRGLMCAAWIGVSLLALNTLLLGALVTGLVLTSVKVQPLLSSVNADDMLRLSAAISAARSHARPAAFTTSSPHFGAARSA